MPRRLLPNLIVSNAIVPIVKGIFEPCNAFPGTRLFDYLIHFGVIKARPGSNEALGPVILSHFGRGARAVQSNNS
jgi:hypothetical protein